MTEATPMGGANEELRALLFGNVPIEAWPADDGGSSGEAWAEPWSLFVRARAHLRNGDQDLAIREWSQIANPICGWESRQVLQAWTFLRAQGIVPDGSIAGEVLGVVVEIAMEGSHDVLAAYADRSVRFLHHLGGATIVEQPMPELDPHVTATLEAGQALAAMIGPWTEPALPPLPAEASRLTMLTRAGPCFGQGPLESLVATPASNALFTAATGLFQAIVALPPPSAPAAGTVGA